MRIAIASAKGGTGKTLVTVNLGHSYHDPLLLLDCDVEEPNSNLFLQGELLSQRRSSVLIPKVNESLCNGCKICSEACEFNAIAVIGGTPLIFEDLCHSCGACATLCPQQAITEVKHEIGTITIRQAGKIRSVEGALDVGKALAVPVIRAVKGYTCSKREKHILLDSPPGTSCPMVWTIRDVDFVILVAEPTAFGLHDLKLAVATVNEVGTPFGVVINKDGLGDDRLEHYCKAENIEILARIPHDRRIAEVYARGGQILDELPEYRPIFSTLWQVLEQRSEQGGQQNA